MRKWDMWPAVVLVVCFAAGPLLAVGETTPRRAPVTGMRRVWGKVAEISLKKRKIAVEVETEPDKSVIMTFLLTEDTKVRKEEKAKSLEDLRKGISVIVFYRQGSKKSDTPTAVLIRIHEGRRWGRKH